MPGPIASATPAANPPATPRVCAVLLAAGASTRFGADNKLLAALDGAPLVRHVADALTHAPLSAIVVVTGPDADAITAALESVPASFVHNPRHLDGMGGSLAIGIAAVPEDCDGALVITGDMPCITSTDIERLLAAFAVHGSDVIVFAADSHGHQRNPVLWPRRHFSALTMLSGPSGGKALLERHCDDAIAVTLDDAHVVDIDTHADLERLRAMTRTARA